MYSTLPPSLTCQISFLSFSALSGVDLLLHVANPPILALFFPSTGSWGAEKTKTPREFEWKFFAKWVETWQVEAGNTLFCSSLSKKKKLIQTLVAATIDSEIVSDSFFLRWISYLLHLNVPCRRSLKFLNVGVCTEGRKCDSQCMVRGSDVQYMQSENMQKNRGMVL